MITKIGINGFGRIGRLCLRAAIFNENIEVAAVNSTADPRASAHLFKYDSTHGIFPGTVDYTEDALIINGKKILLLSDRNPEKLPWGELGADVIIESTGKFRTKEDAKVHLNKGAKKVIISAPGKNMDATFVMGVNEKTYIPNEHHIVSNASCTTNCLAPVIKVLNDNLTINSGIMTTVHAFTNDQKNLDNRHKDLRRARGCTQSIIPTTTGAAEAVANVIPEMKGKLSGLALRVPTPDVSLVDLVIESKEKVTVEEINNLFKEASETYLQGILCFCNEPLVSVDFTGNANSTIIDGLSTMVINDHMIKVLAWYDNEWGYSCRVIDLAAYIGKSITKSSKETLAG